MKILNLSEGTKESTKVIMIQGWLELEDVWLKVSSISAIYKEIYGSEKFCIEVISDCKCYLICETNSEESCNINFDLFVDFVIKG